MGWKERKREQGYRDVLVWLEPAAVEALEQLKAASPGLSVADLVSRAVIVAAGMELPMVAGPVAGGLDPVVVSLKDQLAGIEERLARVEASTMPSATVIMPVEPVHRDNDLEAEAPQAPVDAPEDQDGGAEGEPAKRRNWNGRVDQGTLLEAVADKVEEVGGWDFNVTALFRELEAKGLKVHGHARNFCTWVTKHHTAIEAILDQRRATR
ncbi:hypothetical protein [Solidesulfovibrio carbinolicus]|uniref:Uncharacterized protein n=1 Tax=Solidesulfovibrio carbinolicus TaxID=296842 RepID=A0A4P6HVW6_9BACT|nr:hypothetical protein [Solidesulfovibrio carbinolicus]QAZ69668.1 hypothetical protein C3Y92_20545 [Solidesulfovibrio carbinolicus]